MSARYLEWLTLSLVAWYYRIIWCDYHPVAGSGGCIKLSFSALLSFSSFVDGVTIYDKAGLDHTFYPGNPAVSFCLPASHLVDVHYHQNYACCSDFDTLMYQTWALSVKGRVIQNENFL